MTKLSGRLYATDFYCLCWIPAHFVARHFYGVPLRTKIRTIIFQSKSTLFAVEVEYFKFEVEYFEFEVEYMKIKAEYIKIEVEFIKIEIENI